MPTSVCLSTVSARAMYPSSSTGFSLCASPAVRIPEPHQDPGADALAAVLRRSPVLGLSLNDKRLQPGHPAIPKPPDIAVGMADFFARFALQGDLAERRNKVAVPDQVVDLKLRRLLVFSGHPLTNGLFAFERLVADKGPFRVFGAEGEEAFVVALQDGRIGFLQNLLVVLGHGKSPWFSGCDCKSDRRHRYRCVG